ncbi:uncharacterized protein FA14DRAFT_187541 [Meira miltonrushii]|uniref:Transmembrane protein n=1 Tax=Meira miltonrushii TaxID=1280837 RepID=A0A316VJN2_9BASI|nr:uncharacterized protein FA14DRAFT_187541 [Meira miltonrushii]PWN37434.1 hypothetical protein FA14DRAFT_187541 [Meira miltonrushii]
MSEPAKDEAGSSSSFKLPSRQSYFTTLSAIAFASGLGIAAVVTIRRGRKMKMEDMQTISRPLQNSQLTQKRIKDESPLGNASSKGVFALFGEMNRSIFKKQDLQHVEDTSSLAGPSALRRSTNEQTSLRGKNVQESVFDSNSSAPPPVFDSNSSAPPPSVLMRSKPKPEVEQGKKPIAQDQIPQVKVPIGESPVVMAIKAIGIATGIVGIATWVSIEIACRVLHVKNMDELIEKLTSIVPASERKNAVFDKIGQSARQSLEGAIRSHDKASDIDTADAYSDSRLRTGDSDRNGDAPLPVGEAVKQLDEAVERGDAAAWMEILSRQLNAERRIELEERQSRMSASS